MSHADLIAGLRERGHRIDDAGIVAAPPGSVVIPDFPALLKVLDDRDIRYGIDDEQVRIDAPAGAMVPEIRMAIRRYRDLLAWTVKARGTGHVWAACTECGQAVLLDPAPRLAGKTVWPRCYLTPGCNGRHTTEAP